MAESFVGRFMKWLTVLVVVFGVAGVGYWYGIQVEVHPSPEPGVVLFRHNKQSQSTEQRAQGFIDTMRKEFPNVRIHPSESYLGTTRASSARQSRLVIETFGNSITGVVCLNEANSIGCLQTLEESGLSGTIPFVGFDFNVTLVAALMQGKMAGIVLQDPVQIGYEAVNTALAHLQKKPVEKRVIMGHHLATTNNIDSEELRPFLYPEHFSGGQFTPENAEFTIAVVTKGLTHEFWQSVHAGAEKAARESRNTLIRFEAPVLEQDVEGQIEIVRQLIADKVSAICLSPIHSVELGEVVIEAQKAGVPVVIFDSGLDAENAPEAAAAIVSYVATNNYEAGATAARCVAAALSSESPDAN